MQEDRAIQEFLGEQPRAEELAEMRQILTDRLRRLSATREETPPPERPSLESRIAALREQIAALEREELITQFVEDSVRVTLSMGSVVDGEAEA